MTTVNHLMWIVTALSLAGVVLNIYKRPACFAIWTVTNLLWGSYNLYTGAYAQAAMFGVYFLTSVWGFIQWRRGPKGVIKMQINPKETKITLNGVDVDFIEGELRHG